MRGGATGATLTCRLGLNADERHVAIQVVADQLAGHLRGDL